MNFSFSVQQNIGFCTVIDVDYVGSLARHLLWRRNINPVPLGANFLTKNAGATNPAVALQPSFLRPITGSNNILISEWASSSNYHSLQGNIARFSSYETLRIVRVWQPCSSYAGQGSLQRDCHRNTQSPGYPRALGKGYDRSLPVV